MLRLRRAGVSEHQDSVLTGRIWHGFTLRDCITLRHNSGVSRGLHLYIRASTNPGRQRRRRSKGCWSVFASGDRKRISLRCGPDSSRSSHREPGGGDIAAQTIRVLDNLEAILKGANCTLQDVVKVTVFMTDLNDFGKMNEAYGSRFGSHRPARSTVQVSKLPGNAPLEIEVIARLPRM